MKKLLCIILLLFGSVYDTQAQGIKMVLSISGIDGETNIVGIGNNLVLLKTMNFKEAIPINISAGSASGIVGEAVAPNIIVTMVLDKSFPLIAKKITANELMTSINIKQYQPAAIGYFLAEDIQLEQVKFRSWETNHYISNDEPGGLLTLEIAFGKMKRTYRKLNINGVGSEGTAVFLHDYLAN